MSEELKKLGSWLLVCQLMSFLNPAMKYCVEPAVFVLVG